jgi:hypothetical protein
MVTDVARALGRLTCRRRWPKGHAVLESEGRITHNRATGAASRGTAAAAPSSMARLRLQHTLEGAINAAGSGAVLPKTQGGSSW